LRQIHDSGFIHLDLKPANIFITFEGVLKIGDFGMAAAWPVQSSIEGEGDRKYIGPEILLGQYDKPADVFAIGLIMLEIAGNVQLPNNGAIWQRLRSGDMSDVPSLSWSAGCTNIQDATGISIEERDDSVNYFGSDDEREPNFGSPIMASRGRNIGSRRGELQYAPPFMRNIHHQHALDKIILQMISPLPRDRPMIHEVLESKGLQWVEARRHAGATVFEGNWGPVGST
jgi:mitosis inhibitor protein kinase SWE1